MNRTERMNALVEELLTVAPRRRSRSWLAGRLEVSTRTIERDVAALQRAGLPIGATGGRDGGYALAAATPLPLLAFTPDEAAALLVAVAAGQPSPLGRAGHAGLKKITAAFSGPGSPASRVPGTVVHALAEQSVLEIDYTDRRGVATSRSVDPVGLITADRRWYLVAWCRLRGDYRAFRLDRIRRATTRRPARRARTSGS